MRLGKIMITKTGLHATLALTMLAQLKPGEYAGAAQIAKSVGAPANYLGKMLKQLAAQGILESQKGFGGGFRLAIPASKIRLLDILGPIEKVGKWSGCFLGRNKCSSSSPCAVHGRWSKIRDEYLRFLENTTVAELASKK
jgi:Rrf2 family transcriptional regulator, iron-sulfur cluster assembly transcription factor